MNHFEMYFCLLALFVGILCGFSAGMIFLIRRQNVLNKDLIYSNVIETSSEPQEYDHLEPNLKW